MIILYPAYQKKENGSLILMELSIMSADYFKIQKTGKYKAILYAMPIIGYEFDCFLRNPIITLDFNDSAPLVGYVDSISKNLSFFDVTIIVDNQIRFSIAKDNFFITLRNEFFKLINKLLKIILQYKNEF